MPCLTPQSHKYWSRNSNQLLSPEPEHLTSTLLPEATAFCVSMIGCVPLLWEYPLSSEAERELLIIYFSPSAVLPYSNLTLQEGCPTFSPMVDCRGTQSALDVSLPASAHTCSTSVVITGLESLTFMPQCSMRPSLRALTLQRALVSSVDAMKFPY